jgi:hypothetical protein
MKILYFSLSSFFILLVLLFSSTASAIGRLNVDEEAATRALERSLVQSGNLLLDKGKFDAQISVGFSRREHDNLLFNINNGSVVGQTKNTFNNVTIPISLRLGLPYKSQISVTLPLRYIDQQFIQTVGNNAPVDSSRNGSGTDDISITLSKTLAREKGKKPDIVGFASWNTTSGKKQDNGIFLSSGFNEFRSGLTLTKRQDPLVFSTTLSTQVTVEKDNVKPGNEYGLSLATFLAASPSTSLKFSIDQIFIDRTEINNKEIIDSEQTIALLNIGISSVISSNTFLAFSVGAGLTNDSPDYTTNISLSTRFNLPTNR